MGLFGWWENVSVELGLNWIILTFPFDAMEWLIEFFSSFVFSILVAKLDLVI